MEIKWVEDFLCLSDKRSFSRAAKERHVSQPALSRRIQALEAWLGAQLLDRSTNPLTLTTAGRVFRSFAADMLRQLYEARGMLRGHQPVSDREVQFAVAHTLSLTFFPQWFEQLNRRCGRVMAQVQATNILDGAHTLTQGNTDFLLCYHHAQLPITLPSDRYQYITLGHERMRPYSACDEAGRPTHRLPGTMGRPIPFMAYASNTFLGQVVEMQLLNAPQPHFLHRCFQTHMSEALKAMIVQGHGLGWLPESCVADELASGKIAPAGSAVWNTDLEIRIYRAVDNRRPIMDRLWSSIVQEMDTPEK